MSDRINNSDNKNLNYLPLVNLFEFLIGKYSGLHIRIEYNQKDELVFTIEKCIHEEEMIIFDELNSLLTSAGLIYVDNGNPHKSWIFKSNNQIIFINKIKSISEWICNNYTIKKPESVEKTSSYNIKTHIKRDEFLKK